MAHWKSFAIFVWRERADAPIAREVVAFGNRVMDQHPMFTVLHVVEETAGLPTPEGRDELLAPARVHKDRVVCVGMLLPERHFAAAMMRVFVRAAGVILRGQVQTVVQPTPAALVRDVLAIHRRRTDERIEDSQLAEAIEAARALVALRP